MSQLIGRVKIDAGGVRVRTEAGATLDIGGASRTVVMDSDGVPHFTEEMQPAVLEFTVLHAAEDDMRALHNMTDVRMSFIADNGVTYIVDRAFSTTPPKISDGKCPFTFNGMAAIKQ